MKFVFVLQINIKAFHKLIVSFSVFVTRHAPSTQNKKLAYTQYFQKSMGDEVDFLSADKDESFIQVDSITLGVHSQACPKYPKQQVYRIFATSQAKHDGWN